MAQHICPGCSAALTIDLGSVQTFALRIKCPTCDKSLRLTDASRTLSGLDQEVGERSLESMVQIALSDGSINEVERSLLKAKAREFGLGDDVLDDFVSKAKQAGARASLELVEDYAESTDTHKDENGFYDWHPFAAKIATLPSEHPHLKRYRDDLVAMISSNADVFKTLARQWDRIYEQSEDSADWDEILEKKRNCLDTAAALRSLRDQLTDQTKAEFTMYVKALAAPTNEGW